jgi:hypothetical protein
MSTLATTLSQTDASQTEILARHLAQCFDWLRLARARNAVTASYQPGLSRAQWQSLARVPNDRNVGNDNECPDGKVSAEPMR